MVCKQAKAFGCASRASKRRFLPSLRSSCLRTLSVACPSSSSINFFLAVMTQTVLTHHHSFIITDLHRHRGGVEWCCAAIGGGASLLSVFYRPLLLWPSLQTFQKAQQTCEDPTHQPSIAPHMAMDPCLVNLVVMVLRHNPRDDF